MRRRNAQRARRTLFACVAFLGLWNARPADVLAQTDGAIVRGRVVDAAGTPLGDFPVLVLDSGGRAVPLRTGRDGRFATIGLTSGALTVQLDAREYPQTAVRCRVPAGRSAFVDLVAAIRSPGTLAPPVAAPLARCRLEPATADVYVIE